MKKRMFSLVVSEVSYKDNFENGEVEGTYDSHEMVHLIVTDLKKAIADFIENYKFYSTDGEVFVDDGCIHMNSMKKADEDGCWCWVDPTYEDIKCWKRGEIDLWSVEYRMNVYEVTTVEDKELQSILGEVKRG